MANGTSNGNTVLYRLKLMLDDDAAVQQMSNQLQAVEQSVRQVSSGAKNASEAIESMGVHAQDITKSFARAPGAVNDLRQSIARSDNAIKDLAASGSVAWGNIQNGALEASEGVERLNASIVRGAERAESSLKGMQNQMVRSRGATYSLGSTASSAASQLSVDLTQSAQDAAFGIENLAASAPFLQEQFGRVKRQAGSFTGALKDIGSALMGPTGVIAGFTLLLTFHDQIASFFTSLQGPASELTRKMDQINKSVDELGSFSGEDFVQGFEELEESSKITNIIERRLNSVRSELALFRSELETLDTPDTLQKLGEGLTNVGDKIASIADESRAPIIPGIFDAIGGLGQLQGAILRSSREILQFINVGSQANSLLGGFTTEAKQAASALNMSVERVKELRQQEEALSAALKAVNAESLEEAKARQMLSETLGIQGEKLDKVTDLYMREQEAREETNSQLERERTLRELQVEAMEPGIEKQREQIKLEFSERRREIKKQFSKNKKQRMKALERLDRAQRMAFRDLGEEAPDAPSTPSFIETSDFVQFDPQLIDGKIQKGFSFTKEAFIDHTEDTSFDEDMVDDAIGEKIPVNGAWVNADDYRSRLEDGFDRRMQLIDMRREEIRDRIKRDEAGFGKTIGPINRFQQRMLKKQQELQKERLRERIRHLKNMRSTHDEEDERYDELTSQIANAQARLQRTIQDHRNETEAQQMQMLRSMVENVKSSNLGDAYSNLFLSIYDSWESVNKNILNDQDTKLKEQAQIISSVGSSVVGAASQIATSTFETWKEQRKQDLENQGKTQKQQREILKREGKKRFQMMKRIKYASAAVSGLEAQVYAWTKGMQMGGLPAAIAMSAASAAKTAFMLNKISQMSIGDRLSGGGAGGGGSPGGKFTQLNQSVSAQRASEIGLNNKRNRNNKQQQSVEETAKKVGEHVARNMPEEVVMDRRTAGKSQRVGQETNNKFIK